MGLSVVNYVENATGNANWGLLQFECISPLKTRYPSHRELMARYFSSPEEFASDTENRTLSTEEVSFLSPISEDVQLFCQGLNYADHRVESGMSNAVSSENLVFMKAGSSICGPNDTILRPKDCKLLDYEIELGLVMREGLDHAIDVGESDLRRYVGAIVLANDVSARDIMFGSPMLQWFRGKSHRTFCPMGPVLYLMEGEDFEKLYSLQLDLKLNGETRQHATTDLLIHKPAQTLTEISTYASLRAGDCLLTGTPGGVLAGTSLKVALAIVLNMKDDAKRKEKFIAAQLSQRRFLEPGDVLELSIKSIDGAIDLGIQRNGIADA